MSFDSAAYMAEEGVFEVFGALLSALGRSGGSLIWMVAAYVLTGLGLYAIAQRRGIRNPWMAWVPVLNYWTLGCIADQYRYVARGEVRNRRKVLIVLEILKFIITVAIFVIGTVGVFNLAMQGPDFDAMTERQVVNLVFELLMPVLAGLLILAVVAMVKTVFTAIAYYDLFASCDPENKVLFLVLGLLISVTLPIFVFICRKKDLGMPPRRMQTPPAEQPVYQEPEVPAYQEPEEPWNNSEE